MTILNGQPPAPSELDLILGTFWCYSCEGRYTREDMASVNRVWQSGECALCKRARRREHYASNPAVREAANQWRRENRERVRDYQIKSIYGLPYGWYDEQLERQGGGCAICRKPPGDKSLHVDHDHACCPIDNHKRAGATCGKCHRGLLCDDCNRGLGVFGDDPQRLEAAAAYLTGGGAR